MVYDFFSEGWPAMVVLTPVVEEKEGSKTKESEE